MKVLPSSTCDGESNAMVSRRALCAGTLAAFASLGAAGCSAASASSESSEDASASGEMTSAQKKLHKQFVATYNVVKQAAVKEQLDREYSAGSYTEDAPYVVADPFGTDTLSCYVRFETADAVTVAYCVSANKKRGAKAFEHVSYGEDVSSTSHEFKVVGLVPGATNTVKLTLTAEDGTVRDSSFKVKAASLKGEEAEQLKVTKGESNTALADGLFTILGNDSSKLDFMYLYDNDGFIRGEVPLIGYRSHRLLFPGDGSMILSVSTTQLAQVSALGQVVAVYETGDFELHHDYVFDDDGNILVLASSAGSEADLDVDREGTDKDAADRVGVEDMLIKIDVATGAVTKLVDLGDIFPALKASAKVASDGDLDWIHINTVQWMGDASVLLSSRETSTIIKLSDIYGTPTVDYLMGPVEFWAGSGFEDKLLTPQGDFSLNAGQHSVTYLPSASGTDDTYDLLVFDNNFGAAESYPKFDWSQLGAAVVTDYSKGEHSFARRFTVDEAARTYELIDQFEVPFSGYVSSVQPVGGSGSVLVDSGQAKTFSEYDRYGLPIATFKMDAEKYIYRVFKYEL